MKAHLSHASRAEITIRAHHDGAHHKTIETAMSQVGDLIAGKEHPQGGRFHVTTDILTDEDGGKVTQVRVIDTLPLAHAHGMMHQVHRAVHRRLLAQGAQVTSSEPDLKDPVFTERT